jgi:hypothetical protein
VLTGIFIDVGAEGCICIFDRDVKNEFWERIGDDDELVYEGGL